MKKSFGTYTFIITIAIVYSIPVLDKSKRNIESHEEYINVYIYIGGSIQATQI